MKAPVGSSLAKARIAAHEAFDPLWKSGTLSRKAAYKWLSQRTGIRERDCHMFLMDEAQCAKVIEVCAPFTERWVAAMFPVLS